MTPREFQLRDAVPEDGAALTRLAHAAKAKHGYSPAQLEIWRADLTIDAASITKNWTRVAETAGQPVGMVQLVIAENSAALEHLWVDPACMGQGIGRALVQEALAESRRRGLAQVIIDADPYAESFYLAMGARRVGEVAAPIEGEPGRVRPQMVLECGIPNVYADFNALPNAQSDPGSAKKRMEITGLGTLQSLARQGLRLHQGMKILFFVPNDIQCLGTVYFDPAISDPAGRAGAWIAELDPSEIKECHIPEDDNSRYPCFSCREDLRPHIDRVGFDYTQECPVCGTSLMAPLFAPDQ